MVSRNTEGLGRAELPEVVRRQYRHFIEAARPAPPLSGRVHIYARVSTTDQSEDNKTSLDQQVRLCLEAIVREGIERPVGIWRDEGYTGFSRLAERPVGKAMLAALHPGDTICIHCVDRFSRQMLAGIADMNELRCREVGIYFAETRDFVPPGSGVWDNNKEFNFHMRMVVAHSERATFRARVTRAQQELLQRGFWPFAGTPYGYRVEADRTGNRRLIEDEREQIVIKEAVRWFGRLGSVRAVTGELNKAEFRNRHNRPFQDYSVRRILQVHGELRQKRLPGEPRQRRSPTNPKGNAKIGEAAENAVEAVLKQKIRDAERAKPFILHLVQHQGCDSYGKLADALNFHGVPTPRGGSWHPTSVKNCLAALGFRLTELINLECRSRPLPDTNQQLSHGPQRPSRGERQQIRERYGLPSNPRGKVQKLLPDIIAMRDQEAGVEPIARILGISEISVKAVIKRYPVTLGRSAEQKMTDKIVKAYATGQQPTEIAKALGISVPGVKYRLRQAQKPLGRTPRKVAAPAWLKAVQKRRSVELGDGVTADKGVPPEVIAALDAFLAGRRKSGVRSMARDKILEIVALTGQEVARDQIANRLGIGKSTVYRVLDQLRQCGDLAI